MARYRKIDIRIWGDREFRRLSKAPPNGQTLFFHLIFGPGTGIIPGAYAMREGGLADSLGWSLEGFRKAFREVSGEAYREGDPVGAQKPMVHADWDAGFVWVPKAINHNPPASANVITSWREAWDELPECDLKLSAYQALRAFVEAMPKAKTNGFPEAFYKALPKPSWKPSAIQDQDQDQDQDQEQEQDPERARAKAKFVAEPLPDDEIPESARPLVGEPARLAQLFDLRFSVALSRATSLSPAKGRPYHAALRTLGQWLADNVANGADAEDLIARLLKGFFANDKARANKFPIAYLAANPIEYLQQPSAQVQAGEAYQLAKPIL